MIFAALVLLATFLPVWLGAEETPVLRPILEKNWHYHMLPAEVIPEVCSAFADQRSGATKIPVACSFRNHTLNECHIFLSMTSLFAQRHEEDHCRGKDH